MRAFHIPQDKGQPITEVDAPDDDHGFAQWCHEQVGGYLEVHLIKGHQNLIMWVDEEGKLKNRGVNARATAISQYVGKDVLVGDVIVTGSKPPAVVAVDLDLETFVDWVEAVAKL